MIDPATKVATLFPARVGPNKFRLKDSRVETASSGAASAALMASISVVEFREGPATPSRQAFHPPFIESFPLRSLMSFDWFTPMIFVATSPITPLVETKAFPSSIHPV